MIDIKSRFTGAVIFRHETAETLREAVVDAVQKEINLYGASLQGADLDGADLRDAELDGANLQGASLYGASLRRANLQGANLDGADLRDADLDGADLRDAELDGANLQGASLYGASLRRANLRGANLQGASLQGAYLYGSNLSCADLQGASLEDADLSGANLDGANLRGANLQGIKDDLFAVLDAAPAEVPALLDALRHGRVNGSTYEGDCACLVGTIARVRGCHYTALKPDQSRPAERWFLAISTGDTPSNNPVSKITVSWIEEWIERPAMAKPPLPQNRPTPDDFP